MEFHILTLILLTIGSQGYLHDYEEGESGKKWVVLVAGGDGWDSYWQQAGVAHAYQVVRRNGIPEENIIVIMANDVVNHTNNPAPGILINRPKGKDVYKGIKVDYTGSDLTKVNFFGVLRGEKSKMSRIGTGKVVESGPLDTIFIYFISAGNSGQLFFPGDQVYADELISIFNELYIRRKYEKSLLYINSCCSGSMFDGLLDDNISVLAITATGAWDCPWDCYWVEEYDTCVGDLFTTTWLENWEKMIVEDPIEAARRMVHKEYQETLNHLDINNMMMYGDFRLGFDKLSSFIGFPKGESSSVERQQNVAEYTLERQLLDNKEYIQRKPMKNDFGQNKDKQIIDKIMNEIYKKIVKKMPEVAAKIGTLEKPTHMQLNMNTFPCYRSIVNRITEKCFSVSKNRQVQINIFANICVVNQEAHYLVNTFIDVTCSKLNTLNTVMKIK